MIWYFCRLYSILSYYKIMAIILCAIQYILVYLYTAVCVSVLHPSFVPFLSLSPLATPCYKFQDGRESLFCSLNTPNTVPGTK